MADPLNAMETPWRDRESLEKLYVTEGMTQVEIADQFNVNQATISRWLKRHDLEYPWRDEGTIRELYEEERLSISKIAKKLNCTVQTVSRWLSRHGIERRTRSDEVSRIARQKPPKQRTTRRGYEVFQTEAGGDHKELRIHRLVAVAEYGFDGVSGKLVHHKNGIPWDNRPDNLEPMTPEEHGKTHRPVDMRWGNSTPREQYQSD